MPLTFTLPNVHIGRGKKALLQRLGGELRDDPVVLHVVRLVDPVHVLPSAAIRARPNVVDSIAVLVAYVVEPPLAQLRLYPDFLQLRDVGARALDGRQVRVHFARERRGAKRPEEDVDQRGARANLRVEQLDHAAQLREVRRLAVVHGDRRNRVAVADDVAHLPDEQICDLANRSVEQADADAVGSDRDRLDVELAAALPQRGRLDVPQVDVHIDHAVHGHVGGAPAEEDVGDEGAHGLDDLELDLDVCDDIRHQDLQPVVRTGRALERLARKALPLQPLEVVAADAELDRRRVEIEHGDVGQRDSLAECGPHLEPFPGGQHIMHVQRVLHRANGLIDEAGRDACECRQRPLGLAVRVEGRPFRPRASIGKAQLRPFCSTAHDRRASHSVSGHGESDETSEGDEGGFGPRRVRSRPRRDHALAGAA
mmetsp:Transcript_43370/g.140679  ORF Transcript_43370/g.140679 Transcript_43370/m.140679 type:complete len:426 (-) Transcript_43370:41-1318(-)